MSHNIRLKLTAGKGTQRKSIGTFQDLDENAAVVRTFNGLDISQPGGNVLRVVLRRNVGEVGVHDASEFGIFKK